MVGTRTKGLRIALVFVAMIGSTLLSHAMAPHTQARIFQVIPADETETPVTALLSNQALFAIGTTDIIGGSICVVGGSTVLDPEGHLTCDGGGAWGESTSVVGLGTFIVPVDGPPLWPGTWKLLADGGDAPGVDALSIPFTVTACPGCPATAAQDVIDGWKAQARSLLTPVTAICDDFEFLSAFGTAKAGAGVVRAGFASGFTFTAEFAGGALDVVIGELDIPQSTEDAALALAHHVACRTHDMYHDIAQDPADPTYLSVVQPAFENLPLSIPGAAEDVVGAFDRVQAYGDAQRVAFERYQAALTDGSELGVHLQSDAMATFGIQLIGAMRDAATAARAYANELDADPNLNNPVMTPTMLQDILTIRARVAQDGFTPSELQQLIDAGLSGPAIDALRATFAEDVSQAPVNVSMKDLLDAAAASLEAALPAFDTFAREMAVVSALTIIPSFDADPVSGPAPLEVTFTDTSMPAGLTASWDFGDGIGGTGSPTSHTYADIGDYTVTLTVSDGANSDSTSRTITVTGNHPPVATQDSLATTPGANTTVNVLANDVDPDGDALTLTGATAFAGSVSCESNGACTYTAPLDIGEALVTYTVSDGDKSAEGLLLINVTTGTPYRTGELFAGEYGGSIGRFTPDGVLIERLTTFPTQRAIQTGMCFDAQGDLFTTNFNGTMSKFGPDGVLLDAIWADETVLGTNSDPESCVVMPNGDILVGEADGDGRQLRRLTPDGELLRSFATAIDDRGDDWIDLAADGCTVYYTSEGDRVLRYNVCTEEQGPDFATDLPGPCYGLRMRDDGGAIVACQAVIIRLGPDGTELQRYDPEGASNPGGQFYFAMNLDPDGTSFWSAGYNSGIASKVDIATGDLLADYGLTNPGGGVFNGLAVFGEILASRNHAPVGVDDSYSVVRDGILSAAGIDGVLANDSDLDGDGLVASVAAAPGHGTLVLLEDGSFTYTPTPGYVGPDSFSYDVSDGKASVGPIEVSIDVTSENQAPVLDQVAKQTIPEMAAFDLALQGSDPDADVLTYSLPSGPPGMSVDSETGVLDWTPTEAQGPGTYSATIRVSDPGLLFAERTFDIEVIEINRDPAMDPIEDVTVHPAETLSLSSTASDPDLPANALSFSLLSGPAGATVNPAGEFAWTPALSDLGDHVVAIAVSDGAGGSAQTSFTIHVVRDATSLVLGGDASGQYSDQAMVTATLKSGSTPLVGEAVTISLGATSTIAATDASGVATAAFSIPGPAGILTIAASYAGGSTYQPSNASGTFTINREDATVEYSGDTIALAGATLNLKATFFDSAAAGYAGPDPEAPSPRPGDIGNARAAFDIYPAGSCLTGTPTTLQANVVDSGPLGDGIGTAETTWSSSTEGGFCVVVRLIGATPSQPNGYYVAPPSEPAGLAVYVDSLGHVTGGGWIGLDGGRATFGFNARATGKKPPKGQLVFVERTMFQGNRAILIVKSNSIDSLRTTGSQFPVSATMTGKATIKIISAFDGSTLVESGNATFTATVVDANQPGATGDMFAIRVIDKNGLVVTAISAMPLGGGDVVAHVR